MMHSITLISKYKNLERGNNENLTVFRKEHCSSVLAHWRSPSSLLNMHFLFLFSVVFTLGKPRYSSEHIFHFPNSISKFISIKLFSLTLLLKTVKNNNKNLKGQQGSV